MNAALKKILVPVDFTPSSLELHLRDEAEKAMRHFIADESLTDRAAVTTEIRSGSRVAPDQKKGRASSGAGSRLERPGATREPFAAACAVCAGAARSAGRSAETADGTALALWKLGGFQWATTKIGRGAA